MENNKGYIIIICLRSYNGNLLNNVPSTLYICRWNKDELMLEMEEHKEEGYEYRMFYSRDLSHEEYERINTAIPRYMDGTYLSSSCNNVDDEDLKDEKFLERKVEEWKKMIENALSHKLYSLLGQPKLKQGYNEGNFLIKKEINIMKSIGDIISLLNIKIVFITTKLSEIENSNGKKFYCEFSWSDESISFAINAQEDSLDMAINNCLLLFKKGFEEGDDLVYRVIEKNHIDVNDLYKIIAEVS